MTTAGFIVVAAWLAFLGEFVGVHLVRFEPAGPTESIRTDGETEADEVQQQMKRLLAEADRIAVEPPATWDCEKCNESNPDEFEVCWRCGQERVGVASNNELERARDG